MSSTPNFTAAQIAADALRLELLILSLIKDVRTAIPVQVKAVFPGQGSPPAIGTVTVQPLVQTVDGTGKLWSLAEVYDATFFRIQSGNSAVVIDPSEGDIGLAVVCDRDISSVIAAMGLAGPGSARTHDMSDLVYALSIRSAKPVTQYLTMNDDGITMLSPNTITIQGQQINLVGPINQTNGDVSLETKLTVPNVDATTDVTVPNGSVNDHVHPGVQTGSGDTGPMTG